MHLPPICVSCLGSALLCLCLVRLAPTPRLLCTELREDSDQGVYVDGLTEEVVEFPAEALGIMSRGARNRHIGCTAMNRESSRSHSVFTLLVECKETAANGLTKSRHSRFNLIDLAGSERQKSTNASGSRLKEASNINKSLSELGNVIQALVAAAKGRSPHVPYRNSKLTFLLRDSLGGNSKTFIVATVSPAEDSFGETMSTLKFAARAKLVKNKAVVNEDSSGTVTSMAAEIRRLQSALQEARQLIGSGSTAVSGVGSDGPSAEQGSGRAITAARAVSAILPSIAKMEALFKAASAAHTAGLRAAGDDTASDALPAGLALELLARAHAEACDTGLPPLALLQAAQGAAEELASARSAAASAVVRATRAEAAKETLSLALERYADLVSRYEQCVAAQRLRLKLRDSASGGVLAAAEADAATAAEITALEQQLSANPANVRLQMMIDDLMEASTDGSTSGLLDETPADGAESDAEVLTHGSSGLRLPASLTYVPAALHAAVVQKLAPQPVSSAELVQAQAQVAALTRENAALKASMQQHEVTWENAETAAKARREDQVICMQQWREEQRWGAKEESLQDALLAAQAATAQAQEAAAAEAAKVVQASAAASRAEAEAREKGVRLDAMELSVARLRREVSTATASGEEEVATVRDNLQTSILQLESEVATLRAQLVEANSAGEEALGLVEQSQNETEEARAQLQSVVEEATALKLQLQAAQDDKSEAELNLEQAQADAKEAAGLLSASDEQISQLKQQLQQAKQEAKQLEIAAQRAEFDYANLVEDAEQSVDSVSALEKRVSELRSETSTLKEQLVAAMTAKAEADAATAKSNGTVAELRAAASAGASEEQAVAAAVAGELETAQAELTQARTELQASQTQLLAVQAQLQAAQEELQVSQAEAADANAAAGDATSKAIAARKALDSAQTELQQLASKESSAVAEAAAYSEGLLDQLDDTRAQLSDSLMQVQTTQEQLLQARSQQEDTVGKLRVAEQLQAAAEAAACTLRNDLATVEAAAMAAAADAAAARGSGEEAAQVAAQQAAELQASNATLRSEVAELTEKLAIVSDESKGANTAAASAQERMAALEAELNAANAAAAQAQGDLQLLQDELLATRGGVQAAKAVSSQAQGALQAIQAELRATDATLSAVSESLEEEVEARKAAEDSSKSAATRAATALAAAHAEAARFKAALGKATDRLEVLEAQADSLRMVQEQLLGAAGGGSEEIMAALEAQRAKAASAAADAALLQDRVAQLTEQLAKAEAGAEVDAAAAKQAAAAACDRQTQTAAALAAVKAELSLSQEDLAKAHVRLGQLEASQEAEEKQASLVQRLETQLARVMQERDTAQQAAKEAHQAAVDAKDKAAAVGGVSGSQAGKIAALETEVSKLTQKVLSEKARNRILARERDDATAEAAAAAREAADATAAHHSAVVDATAASTHATSADQQADSSAGVVAGYAAQLSAARDAMTDLSNAVLHLRARLCAAEEQLDSSSRVKMTLRLNKQLKEAKKHIAELEAGRAGAYPPQVAARDRAIDKLQTELAQLTGAIVSSAEQLGIQAGAVTVPSAACVASARVPQCVPLRSLFASGAAGGPIRKAMAVVMELQTREFIAETGDTDMAELGTAGLACVVDQPSTSASHNAAAVAAAGDTAHLSVPAAKQLVLIMAGTVQGWAASSAQAASSTASPAHPPRSPLTRGAAVPRSPLSARSSNTPQATPQRKHGVRGLTYSPGGQRVMHPPAVGTPEYLQWAAASSMGSDSKHTPNGSQSGDGGFFC